MAHEFRDWCIRTDDIGDPVRPGRQTYALFNFTAHKYLHYGSRRFGINLVWDEKYQNMRFKRSGESEDPIKLGESIALYIKDGGYLRYGRRVWGINLEWSSTPKYEWEFRNTETQEETGKTIKTSTQVGLYNRVKRDFVIYGKRVVGINLSWYKDTHPRPKPDTEPDQEGFQKVLVYNCNVSQGAVTIWIRDATAGSGWIQKGTLGHQYGNGGCPGTSPPLIVDLANNHYHEFVAVDRGLGGCDGRNDPTYAACRKVYAQFRGSSSGGSFPLVVT